MEVGIVILAGGKSSRMGTNKALLPIQGLPNIERLRNELAAVVPHDGIPEISRVSKVIVVTNESEEYRFLGEQMATDRYPGKGPLAGIQAGLGVSPSDWNLVAACDMPFASAQAARFLLQQAVAGSSLDAVVPVIHGQMHPLFAAYHKRSAEKIEDMLISDRLRMIYLLEQLQVKQVTERDFPSFIDVDRVFFNMNRPADWEQARQWISREG